MEIDKNWVFDDFGAPYPTISVGQKVYLSPDSHTASLKPVAFRTVPMMKSLIWHEEKQKKAEIYADCVEILSGDSLRWLIYAVSYWIRGNEAFRRENRYRLERIFGISAIPELDLLENITEKEIFDPFQYLPIKSAYQSLISRFITAIDPQNPHLNDENSNCDLCSKAFNLHIKLRSAGNTLSRCYSSGEQVSLKVRMYLIEDWKVIMLPKEGVSWDKLWHIVAKRKETGGNDRETEEIAAEMSIYGEYFAKLVDIAIKCASPTDLFLSPAIRPLITALSIEIESNPQSFPTFSLFSKVKRAKLQLESLKYPCSSCSSLVPYLSISQVLTCGCTICLPCSEQLQMPICCLSTHH